MPGNKKNQEASGRRRFLRATGTVIATPVIGSLATADTPEEDVVRVSHNIDLTDENKRSLEEHRDYLTQVREEQGQEAAIQVDPLYNTDGPSIMSDPGGEGTVFVGSWNSSDEIYDESRFGGKYLGDIQHDATLYRTTEKSGSQYVYWFWLNSTIYPDSDWWWDSVPHTMDNGINVYSDRWAVTSYEPTSVVPVRERKYRIGSEISIDGTGYGTTDTVYKNEGKIKLNHSIQGESGRFGAGWRQGDIYKEQQANLNATMRLRSEEELEADSDIPKGTFGWLPGGSIEATF